jgi:hypothetical protein
MTQGIVEIAIGEEALINCTCSILSLREFTNKPITVLTDLSDTGYLNTLATIQQVKVTDKNPSRWLKTQLCDYTPYERTLFLDSDVKCVGLFDEVWDFSGDLVLTRDVHPTSGGKPQYNSGFLLFSTDKVRDLFGLWHSEWLVVGGRDQPALTRSLAQWGGGRLEVDNKAYNWNSLNPSSKFLHGWSKKKIFTDEEISQALSVL